jgi:hypothetical protein
MQDSHPSSLDLIRYQSVYICLDALTFAVVKASIIPVGFMLTVILLAEGNR